MTYGSVCSGVEAATLAWHSLNWKPVWFSEIEPFPCKVLKYHYPHVPNLGNMLHLNQNPIYNESTIDLLVGGTPCQSFSIAGLRKGLASENGNLALEFCRILIAKQPRWFVWENVPGALSSFTDVPSSKKYTGRNTGIHGSTEPEFDITQTADFATILTAFRECGYSCAYRILDAQYFGVPQRRRRIFVVGYFGNDWRPPAAVLFDGYSLSGHIEKGRKEGQKGAGTLDARIKGGGFPGSDGAMTGHAQPMAFQSSQSGVRSDKVHATLDKNNGSRRHNGVFYFEPRIARNGRGGVDHVAAPLKAQSGKTGKGDAAPHVVYPIAYGGNNTTGPIDVATACKTKGYRQDFESDTFVLSPVLWSIMPQNSGKDYKARRVDVTQPLVKTQRGVQSAQGGDIIQEGIRVRRLTPLECERLQGMPDFYTNIPGASDTARYQAIGNSMAVPVMAWLGKRIDIVDKYLQSLK